MPSAKRTLQEADPNASMSAPASKNQKRAKEQENEPEQDNDTESDRGDKTNDKSSDPHKYRKPEDWICMHQPFWDFQHAATHEINEADEVESGEEVDDDEEDDEEEGGLRDRYQKEVVDTKIWGMPAAEHPEHKWKIMWDAWKQMCELRVQEDYCDPDNFGMHVYSDFMAYGIIALIEMQLAEFNKEYNKKTKSPDPSSVKHMWATLAALAYWLEFDDGEVLMTVLGADDGERINKLMDLAGCAFLTALDTVERMGWLKSDSEILDLGLVMSVWLKWSEGLPAYGVGEDGETDWRENIVGYAKRAGIDLRKEGCSAIGRAVEDIEDVEALEGAAKAGRWKWPKKLSFSRLPKFKKYKSGYGIGYETLIPYNLPGYDITKWPRSLRAEYSLDGKDPLADIPEKDLKNNMIMLR